MPSKKKEKVMEAKVAALETEMANVKRALLVMESKADENQSKADENHQTLMAMLAKVLDKTTQSDEEENGDEGEKNKEKQKQSEKEKEDEGKSSSSKKGSSTSGLKKLQGEALEEFCQSMKKVELPMFDGDDPAGWILRAEVYFQVQESRPEVRVSLAQLCMEGPTIHFFNSLLDENVELTWEQLKVELLEQYGGMGEGGIFEQLADIR